ERWPTMPMIDVSGVGLPAPLRPSRHTTSPAGTSNVTPCRMCDSPYQACRLSTLRSGAAAVSGMAGPHIGLAHVGIGRDGRVVAFGEHAPAREHRDAVGEVRDHAEVMLDHEHGP